MRRIRNPQYFIGMKLDPSKWLLPSNYAICAKTGRFMHEDNLTASFFHCAFDRDFLIEHNIYIEDADWLSSDGYDEIMTTLENLGIDYVESVEAYYHSLKYVPLRNAA